MAFYKSIYSNKTKSDIKKLVIEKGFDPVLISDPPGRVYFPHSHTETKLLVFLSGSMEVVVDGKMYQCEKGDEVVIDGNVKHSAVVGNEGCIFFWSEKLLE